MLINHLLRCALDLGFDKREVTLIQVENATATLFESADDMFSHSKYISFIFRGSQKDKYITFHSENCDVDTLKRQFEEAINLKKRIVLPVYNNFSQAKVSYKKLMNISEEPSRMLLSDKAKEIYKEIYKKFNEMKNEQEDILFIEQCCFGYLHYNNHTKNNLGFSYQRSEDYYYIVLSLQMKCGNTIYNSINSRYGKDLLKINIDDFIAESLTAITLKAEAQTIETGLYNIVLSNKVAAHLLDAFSPIFFAENIQVGHSCLKDKIGKNIASSIINLYDSGRCNYSSHIVEYDYEGTKVDEKVLIENGILKNYLYNSCAVALDGKTAGGNSFMYDNLIGTNITNFYIKPSDMKFDDLLKIDYGLLVTEISDLTGIINFSTGDISTSISGFEIVNGEIRKAFDHAILNSNICNMLQKVIALDSDMYFTLPDNTGSVGTPNMLIEEINITQLPTSEGTKVI